MAFSKAQVKFDTALRVSLNRIVTNEGAGFGNWQLRMATMPIKRGGLGVLTAADTLNYAFVASRLQSNVLQTRILAHSGIEVGQLGRQFEAALDIYTEVSNFDLLSLNLNPSVPKIMKSMADRYYDSLDRNMVKDFSLDMRQQALLLCVKEEKAQDFLHAIPLEGFGNCMDHRQFRAILCYRLGIPLFSESSVCPSCNVKTVDVYGDHAVQCAHEIGYKFRHNLVRDTVFDVLNRAGILVQKEAPLGFMSSDNRVGLLPADILIYSWDKGRNVCVDITGASPMVGLGKQGFKPTGAAEVAANTKVGKHNKVCESNGYGFMPFAFTTFGGVDSEAIELMRRVTQVVKGHHLGFDHSMYYWPRISLAIQKGVGAQLVSRLPINFL